MKKDENLDALRRIAHLLDVPTSAFFDPYGTQAIRSSGQTARENSELLEVLSQVLDPAIRREYIAFVRSKVERSIEIDIMPRVSGQT